MSHHKKDITTKEDIILMVDEFYKKARKGEIENFTGISAPYEPPGNPEIEIVTDDLTIEESVQKLITYIIPKVSI